MDKIDIQDTYTQIKNAINIDDHEKIVHHADKILKITNLKDEREAFHCKIVALINLGRYDEIISLLEKNKLTKDYVIEYGYALHEKKAYEDSTKFLKENGKNILDSANELIAQNYYKLGNYVESYNIYNEIIIKKLKSQTTGLKISEDLITNCLASYALSNLDTDISHLLKYLNSWESFYNYCVISLKQKKFTECLDSLVQMQNFGKIEDELNEHKFNYLIYAIIQFGFEGFDLSKYTNLSDKYQNFLNDFGNTSNLSELMPYYYNGYISIKKDGEHLGESIRKYDNFLKNEKKLSEQEKEIIVMNKVILLLRANKINDGKELFKTIKGNNDDLRQFLIKCYIAYKGEGLEDFLKINQRLPESSLIQLQIELSHLSHKNLEDFHKKVMGFISNSNTYKFCLNLHFQRFMITFYQTRQLKAYLSEYLLKFKDPQLFNNDKQALILLSNGFYYCGLYEQSVQILSFILDKIDSRCKETQLNLLKCLSILDPAKGDELRVRQLDNIKVDLSHENISSLLSEVVLKFKRNVIKSTKKKKKKKIIYPKNFDPKKPGPMPDAERWVPRLQRKKNKGLAKNKKAYQGGDTSGPTVSLGTGASFSHFGEKR